jgi:maleate cis-trans isomerase
VARRSADHTSKTHWEEFSILENAKRAKNDVSQIIQKGGKIMSYNISSSWRGVVGTIKPTHRPGSLEEFIRFLPEGIGVIPVVLGIKEGTEKEFLDSMEPMKEKVAELAKLNVDLIFPQGAPPFMVRGYRGEEAIVKSLEEKHGIPVVTVGMTQVEALRVLGVKRMIGITYFQEIGRAHV